MDAGGIAAAGGSKKKVADSAAPPKVGGHWGEDAVGFRWTEQDSVDNRFQQMDTGVFFSGTILTPAATNRPLTHTAKALCVRIGEQGEAAMAYDTELLRTTAGWTGPFLQIDPARYGIIVPPKIAGSVQFTTPPIPGVDTDSDFADPRPFAPYGPLPRQHGRYRGLFLHGQRVVVQWQVGAAEIDESPWFETVDGVPIFTRTLEVGPSDQACELLVCGPDGLAVLSAPVPGASCARGESGNTVVSIAARPTPLRLQVAITARSPSLTESRLTQLAARLHPAPALAGVRQPGPARWTAEITTAGDRGEPGELPWAVDTIRLPFDNPYKALLFVSGHDFLPDGTLALSTLHGDVWLVRGIDDSLRQIRWKRFATGLFQPLGVKVVDGQLYVVGRDQITRLHDRDQNGEADWYENFNNDGHVTRNGHEYVTCLETDRAGNFYYLKGDSGGQTQHDGCLLRVTPDGQQLSVYATGFRNANGLGIGPGDEITVAPQEGEWTPASAIFGVQRGGFYGAMTVHHRPTPPTDFELPLCWLPRRWDNSSGGQVWVPPGTWGPLAGRMLHLSYGQSSMMLVLPDEQAAGRQAGVVPLPLSFRSGIMRGRFSPHDGHLYLSGLRGWVSNAADDGCLQRVRYAPHSAVVPHQLASFANGLRVTFSEPLDQATAEDPANYFAEQWNYRWSAQYGSPELRPSQPHMEGRDRVTIRSATLLEDRRSVFLEIPSLKPVSILQLDCEVTTTAGETARRAIAWTLHTVPSASFPENRIRRRSTSGLTEAQLRALRPGLLFEFGRESGTQRQTDWSHRRLAALHVPPGEAPSSFLAPGPFQLTIRGYVRGLRPGSVRLRAAGTGSAHVYLGEQHVGGFGPAVSPAQHAQWLDERHPLREWTPLRIEYQSSDPAQAAEFRLLWQGEDGIEELIATEAFLHDAEDPGWRLAERQRLGLDRFLDGRCVRCHRFGEEPSQAEVAALKRLAPSLKSAGSRLEPTWLAAWLMAPQEHRDRPQMPDLLSAEEPVRRQQAAHLAAYLSSLGTRDAKEPAGTNAQGTEPERGRELWEQLGCIGCHHRAPVVDSDPYARVSLHGVAKKYRPGALRNYLQQPQAVHPTTRMPDFHLTAEESAALAAFLEDPAEASSPSGGSFPAGDARIGAQLAETLRCHACHEFEPDAARRTVERIPIAGDAPLERGCLADHTAPTSTAPRWFHRTEEREALRSLLRPETLASWQPCAVEDADRRFAALRCHACHARDGESSQLPGILAEEGELGWLPDPLPDLTWAGERLRREWMAAFLRGSIPERPRPQWVTRMPAFPAEADLLAAGFAARHAVVDAEPSSDPQRPVPEILHHGYWLTRKEGGLDCRQCHAVGSQPAQGDDKTRLAPGINFSLVRDRLRYDFYRRFMLDPPRYDPSIRMPKLSADGRTTPARDVLDGDAVRQFEAIWQYLQTIHDAEP